MSKKRKSEKITIEMDVAKIARILSRAIFGRPGKGRKTRFDDRKKKANKRACREKVEE
jgi:hypothetical protein